MELNKEQVRALAAVLYDEINTLVRDKNSAAIEEVENSEEFNDAYNEFRDCIQEARQLKAKAEKISTAALSNLRKKLSIKSVSEYDTKHTISNTYAQRIGKVKEIPTKQGIMDRIMLATINAEDLQTVKENVLKLF